MSKGLTVKNRGLRWALGICLTAALATSGYAVEYQGKTLPAVDLHLHPGSYDSLGPLGKAFVRDRLPGFIPPFLRDFSLRAIATLTQNPYGAFVGIKSQCIEAKMTYCGLFATYARETWGLVPNSQIRQWIEDKRNINPATGKPLFFGLASLDILDWDAQGPERLKKLEQDLSFPQFKGIKLAFIHNDVPLDDPRFDGIYELAARTGKPVYHHVGSTPLRQLKDFPDEQAREHYVSSFDPRELERAIRSFPQLHFVLGHMGFDFNKEGFTFDENVFELALRYPNVYLEISAFGGAAYDPDGKYKDKTFARIKEAGLIPRTIYGSDGPGAPGGVQRYLDGVFASFARVGYTAEEVEQIMYGNTAKLYNLE